MRDTKMTLLLGSGPAFKAVFAFGDPQKLADISI
jgi:hypothetical protein